MRKLDGKTHKIMETQHETYRENTRRESSADEANDASADGLIHAESKSVSVQFKMTIQFPAKEKG